MFKVKMILSYNMIITKLFTESNNNCQLDYLFWFKEVVACHYKLLTILSNKCKLKQLFSRYQNIELSTLQHHDF